MTSEEHKDFFICHASDNKDSVARPLADKFIDEDLSVWFDEYSLIWGNKLMESINKGLKNSSFGIVILSKEFQGKKWPQHELDGLFALTKPDETKILPLRYGLTQEELDQHYPLLSGILSRSWPDELETILIDAQKLVKSKQKTPSEPSYATTSVSKSKFTGLFDPKYVGRTCGRCGRRVKEEHYITDGKCSFCGYDLDGDRLVFGM